MDKHSLGIVKMFVAGDIERSIAESKRANLKVLQKMRKNVKKRMRE